MTDHEPFDRIAEIELGDRAFNAVVHLNMVYLLEAADGAIPAIAPEPKRLQVAS